VPNGRTQFSNLRFHRAKAKKQGNNFCTTLNTMSDCNIVNKGYVKKLEEWRGSVLPDVVANWYKLSEETQQDLKVVNYFFCGLHFETGMGDYAEATIKEWEQLLGEKLGRDRLKEFVQYNENSSCGKRLVRHTCEVLSAGLRCSCSNLYN
jgi:hypothetical protein